MQALKVKSIKFNGRKHEKYKHLSGEIFKFRGVTVILSWLLAGAGYVLYLHLLYIQLSHTPPSKPSGMKAITIYVFGE